MFQAETAQKVACEKFDQMSDKGKEGKSPSIKNCFYLRNLKLMVLKITLFAELMDFKTRRVIAFRKHLIELAELEVKHAKVRCVHIVMYFHLPLFLTLLASILTLYCIVSFFSRKYNISRTVLPV